MKDKTIKEIYDVKELSGEEYSLVTWHNNVINKTIADLTCGDVARMLRQEVFNDLAIDVALKMLEVDPFAGELYIGELAASLLEVEESALKSRTSEVEKIIKDAKKDINSVTWGYPEEKDEFLNILKKLDGKIKWQFWVPSWVPCISECSEASFFLDFLKGGFVQIPPSPFV